jgi:hypothetical protein
MKISILTNSGALSIQYMDFISSLHEVLNVGDGICI